jgi:hypothetical protein
MSENGRTRRHRRGLVTSTKLPKTHLLKIHHRRTLSQSSRCNAVPTKYLPNPHPGFLTVDASPCLSQRITPIPTGEFKPDVTAAPQPTNPQPFDPLSATTNVEMFPAAPGNGADWDMQELVWSNLPWDWNLMDCGGDWGGRGTGVGEYFAGGGTG